MRVNKVVAQLIGLQGLSVKGIDFDGDALVINVARKPGAHRCPHCGFKRSAAYDTHERDWRHVPLGKWRVVLRAKLCRLVCRTHGVVCEAIPWAEHESRFTRDFEDLAAWLTREMNQTAVTRLLKVAWVTVGSIVERVVQRCLNKQRLDDLYVIGIDEVSYRKGHKYLTVIADQLESRLVWLGEGRSKTTVEAFFEQLGAAGIERLKVVTMDMSGPFISEVTARAPHAVIAFDPFHVVKLANEALQEVRRREAREVKGTTAAEVLKGSRWSLLKAPEDLRPSEKVKLSEVSKLNRRVYRAYLLKEELRALYQCTPKAAERHLDAWLKWASTSRLPEFVTVAATLRKYRDGVLAAINYGVSNGMLEGLNNKIGMLKHRAFGFHSAAALISMVYLCCSNIHINLPT